MVQEDYRMQLSELIREDLNIIAKKLSIKNYRRGTKEQLIDSILLTRTPEQIRKVVSVSFWDRYHIHIYGVAGVVLAAVGLFPVIFPRATQDNKKMSDPRPSEVSTLPTPAPTRSIPLVDPASTSLTIPTVDSSSEKLHNRKSASIYLNQARALYVQKQYNAALAKCDKALRLDRNNQEALDLRELIRNQRDLVNQ